MNTNSFYWYDYETFGTHPGLDRAAQFAGLRTTPDLEIIGEPLVVYNQLSEDYLPDPVACKVTGITPQEAQQKGVPERKFISAIKAEVGYPGTCNVGYNNIRFDDEFTRFMLFRNFYDPYEHEWRDGNSRWDLLDVVRLTRALRPEGINWPLHPDGKPSNKLEDLTSENGLSHEHAHDALSDVHATIAVARLLREKRPQLFDYAFTHRGKQAIASLLNLRDQQAVVHVSGMIPGDYGHTAIVAPLMKHPTNKNGIVVFDLRYDPSELASLDAAAIQRRIFTPTQSLLPGESRLALKTIHINKAPVVVPLGTLDDASAERLHINKAQSLVHLKLLQNLTGVKEVVAEALKPRTLTKPNDPDVSLYAGGFFSEQDRIRFKKIREADEKTLATHSDCFDDDRADELLFRYRARNFFTTLNDDEKLRWFEHCREKLTADGDGNEPSPINRFHQLLDEVWPPTAEGQVTDLRQALEKWENELTTRIGLNPKI